MSRMSQRDMVSRVQPLSNALPKKQGQSMMPAVKKTTTVTVPKGGEVHVQKIDNGHLATVRDSNYNTVSTTFVEDTGQLRLD